MKRFILISFLILFLFSCLGTRNVDKNKSVQKNEEKTEQNSNVKKESESKETANVSTETNSESKASVNIKVNEIDKQNELSTKTKTDSETNETKLFISEFFENGNLKSKTEYSANQSKLLQENSNLKKENEYFYSTILAKQEENKIISVQNSFLERNNKAKSDSIGTLKKQIENFSKNTSNKTERKAYPVWVWILIGIIIGKFGWDILKFFLNKIKASQWYLSLIEKFTK